MFPANVVSPKTNFLNDIVVGCHSETNCWAYISDATDSKIIVYNHEEDRSWFVHHPLSMNPDPEAYVIHIIGKAMH